MAQTKAEINNKLPPSVKYSASQYDIVTELGYGLILSVIIQRHDRTGQNRQIECVRTRLHFLGMVVTRNSLLSLQWVIRIAVFSLGISSIFVKCS